VTQTTSPPADLLLHERDKFEVDDGVAYFNTASISPLLRSVRAAAEAALDRRAAAHTLQSNAWFDDVDRLRGILPRVVEEARQALDAELDSLNRASLAERMKIARRGEPKISAPDGGWQIQILENTDEDVNPGDIVIYSELGLPAKPEFGAGSMTKRIATRRMGGATSSSQTYEPAADQGAYAVIELVFTLAFAHRLSRGIHRLLQQRRAQRIGRGFHRLH